MYTNGSPFLLPYLGTSVIFDNLFTKHSTHMAYISRPLVRKFGILQIRRIDLSKFEIFQTILRNRSTLTPTFWRAVYFPFYKPQVMSLIWQACFTKRSLNIFWMVILLNKGNLKGTFWAEVKYDNIYTCVLLVYFLTSRMSFLKISYYTLYRWICKQNIMW